MTNNALESTIPTPLATPAFSPTEEYPFNRRVELVDIDGDGDIDALMGSYEGKTLFFENTANAGSTAPSFAPPIVNPFGISDVGFSSKPHFVDIDGDGDLDAFIGNKGGQINFFRNTASIGSKTPAFAAPVMAPFGLQGAVFFTDPGFADVDGDGDLDAFVGSGEEDIRFYRNNAASGSTDPAFGIENLNFGLENSPHAPTLVDIDSDGDLDAFQDDRFYRNTAFAGSSDPAYSRESSPFGFSSTQWADIDNDGDLDTINGATLYQDIAPLLGANSPHPDGVVIAGDEVLVTIKFSEIVFVNGSPLLLLETGDIDRFANYTGGSGTDTLSFLYNVQPGDQSDDLDQHSANALILNGGTIRDADGNNAALILAAPRSPGSLSSRKNLEVASTKVVEVSATNANGNYGVNATINITIQFSEAVEVIGVPLLQLETGSINRFATYAGGSGTRTLDFSFIVQPEDRTADLDVSSSRALTLNGGSIRNVIAGGHVSLTIANPGFAGSLGANKNLVITGNAVRVLVTTPEFKGAILNPFGLSNVGGFNYIPGNTGYYARPFFIDIDDDGDLDAIIGNREGRETLYLNTAIPGSSEPAFQRSSFIQFDRDNAVGAAGSTLVDIDSDGDIDHFSGTSDGNTMFKRNLAEPGGTSPSYAPESLNPFGLGDVGDAASPQFVDIDNDGDLDVFIGNADGDTLYFQNKAPLLGLNSTTPNGFYNVGDVIRLTLTFSDIVVVTGIPRIQLETVSIDRFATYTGGSGSNILLFTYTVQADDHTTDLDQHSSFALSLNGGSIRDAAGNHADLTLAAPGSPGSLRSRKNLVIDGSRPTFTEGPLAGNSSSIRLTVNEAVTAELLPSTGPALLSRSLAANTSTLIDLSARAVVTTASLVVTDRAGNRTLASTKVQIGTNSADTLNGEEDGRLDPSELLFGFSGNDTLNGLNGNDILDGGSGNDSLNGGSGSDTYSFDSDSQLGTDFILDTSFGGSDTFDFSATSTRDITVDLRGIRPQPQLVNAGLSLILAPRTKIENVDGGAGNDTITGNLYNNRLLGYDGNDVLEGLAGKDILNGGAGDDTYIFDTLFRDTDRYPGSFDGLLGTDILIDSDGGSDTLDFSGVFKPAIVINLSVTDRQAPCSLFSVVLSVDSSFENVIGGANSDTITGNALENTLYGRDGNDTLAGGSGADRFRFDTPLNAASNRDSITDFSVVQGDRIELENSVFTALPTTGTLTAAAFFIGDSATTAGHRILYNNVTGLLSFDSDGNGATAAIAFAALSQGLALTNASFTVI